MSVEVARNSGWARDPIRAAGGRRAYNARRQLLARIRRREILEYLDNSAVSLLVRGTQRTLAQHFKVSESTISRDMRGILAEQGGGRKCLLCGATAIDSEADYELERAENALQERLGI
jgi:DeoR/GlpR family transcriptional regulator of sugar metabolism